MEHPIKIFDENKKLLKAGGVIVRERDGQREVLLIGFDGDYSFPKGHVEVGDLLEEEAIRECFEETGLKTKIIKKLPTLEYQNTETGDYIVIHFFHMEVVSGELKSEYNDMTLEWVPIDRAENMFSYPNLREYMKSIKSTLI